MKLLGAVRRQNKIQPPMVCEEVEIGERLLSDARYMEPEAAASVIQLVESWRAMPRDEFEECARHL
jgi:hypothetical protein